MSVLEIYQETVLPLSPPERLQLATLILSDIAPAQPAEELADWSEEDMREFSRQSWNHICQRLDEEEHA